MPAVTLTALCCGTTILVAARTGRERALGPRARAGLRRDARARRVRLRRAHRQQRSLCGAERTRSPDWSKAEAEARKAARWAPWSSDPWQLLGQIELAQGDEVAARAAFQKAIDRDPNNWELWLALAGSSDGRAQERALAEVARLNPFTAPGSERLDGQDLRPRPPG